MGAYDFDIPVTFRHRIRFTKDAFAEGNSALADLLEAERERKVIVFLESSLDQLFPGLQQQIQSYLETQTNLTLTEIVIMAGGEDCKISKTQIMDGIIPIERNGIDRHSYVFCIGGGAFLDVTDEEPLPATSELWALKNMMITPHSSCIYKNYKEEFLKETLNYLP